MNIKVLLQVARGLWLIEPNAADSYALMLHKMLMGEKVAFRDDDDEDDKVKEFAYKVDITGKRIGTIQEAEASGIGVINMRGAVAKYDYCGSPGTQSMIKALDQANANPSISAIILQIDSPGGTVDGTQQFANAVKNSKKPVVAYVNGMMCSAAMWIGSAASERIASSNTDMIGSIGTMARWVDWSGYYKKMDLKIHEVYATASTHKNLDMREAAEGNYERLITTGLDPINDEFTGTIEANLPNVDKSALNGAHFTAKEAKKKGLIDKVGTFETAVRTALQLGKQNSTIKNMAFEKTLTTANAASFEVVDGGFLLDENHLNAIESALNTSAENEQSLSQQLESARQENAGNAEALQTANNRIAELEGQVTTLKNAAPSFSATTKTSDDQQSGETPKSKKDKYRTSFDEQAAAYSK